MYSFDMIKEQAFKHRLTLLPSISTRFSPSAPRRRSLLIFWPTLISTKVKRRSLLLRALLSTPPQ